MGEFDESLWETAAKYKLHTFTGAYAVRRSGRLNLLLLTLPQTSLTVHDVGGLSEELACTSRAGSCSF
jgi:hypothetical protein